jgi:hypothetical protein
VKPNDPRVAEGAFITDDVELFQVLLHEATGRRTLVDACGPLDAPTFAPEDVPRWLMDLEIGRDFRLAKA